MTDAKPVSVSGPALCTMTLAVLFVLAGAHRSPAQIVQGAGSSFMQRALYVNWDLKGDTTDASVFQWFVPIIVRSGFASDWELTLQTSAAGSESTWLSADDGIRGINDSRIQIAHSLADNQVLLSAGVSLPTGKTELTERNRQIIPWLTSDFLNFPSKYPGEGFNVFGEAAYATPAGRWVVGFGGAVYYAGEYTPFDDGRTYQPGMRFSGTAGAHHDWPAKGSVAADLVVTVSTDDKAQGVAVFADGVQFDARLTGNRIFETAEIRAMARLIIRGKNKVLSGSDADLLRESANTNGDDFRVSVSGSKKLGRSLSGWVSAEGKFLAANGYTADDVLYEAAARITGAGAGVDFLLGANVVFGFGGRAWTGSTDGGYTYEALDLSGYELQQRLTVTF